MTDLSYAQGLKKLRTVANNEYCCLTQKTTQYKNSNKQITEITAYIHNVGNFSATRIDIAIEQAAKALTKRKAMLDAITPGEPA